MPLTLAGAIASSAAVPLFHAEPACVNKVSRISC